MARTIGEVPGVAQDQQWVGGATLDRDVVVGQLERILSSDDFDASPRSRAFFSFIVEEMLAGRQEELTQSVIATRVFERRDDFNPTVDPIVRIQAGRLRRSLERYYLMAGAADAVRIELPRGTYVPLTRWTHPGEESAREAPAVGRTLDADGWPSVIVSVFDAEGAELAAAAEWLQEEMCIEMGRYGDVSVVLQRDLDQLGAAGFGQGDFALSGHLSCSESGLRVHARLVDCRNARQVWAEEYRAPSNPVRSALRRNRPQDRGTRRVRAGGGGAPALGAAAADAGRRASALRRDPALLPVLLQSRALRLPPGIRGPAADRARAAGVRPRLGAARAPLQRELRVRDRLRAGLDRRGDHAGAERRSPRSLQPASAGGARRRAPDQGRAGRRARGGGEGLRAQPRLVRLPGVGRLAARPARRVGPRNRPDPPRHAAQSERGHGHAVRALGESHAPRILRAGLPDGAPVPGRHLLLEAADAGVQPRPPRTPGGGEARGGGAAAAEAQFPEPRPGPDRPLLEVPRPRGVVVEGLAKAGLKLD